MRIWDVLEEIPSAIRAIVDEPFKVSERKARCTYIPRSAYHWSLVSNKKANPNALTHVFWSQEVFAIGNDHILHPRFQYNGRKGPLLPGSVITPVAISVQNNQQANSSSWEINKLVSEEDVNTVFCIGLVLLLRFQDKLFNDVVRTCDNTDLEFLSGAIIRSTLGPCDL